MPRSGYPTASPFVDSTDVKAGSRLGCCLVVVVGSLGVAGGQAAAPDPIVGTWERGTFRTDVTQVGPSSFVGRALAGGTVGPCSYSARYLKWELTKGAGGAYTGTNHGLRWDSLDPKTCRDLPIVMTAKLGTISHGRLSMSLCLQATDVTAAQCHVWTRSVTEPLATLVPIESVSNGCGGTGWRALEKVQNYLGNTSVYWNSRDGLIFDPEAKRYKVDFSAACDLHDAGYAGAIVRDKLRGGIKDFRGWSRKQVDDKFLADMRMLCTRAIPKTAVFAVRNCRARGGNVSFGAVSRYAFVRTHGWRFFDADLTKPGTQRTGNRANN